MQVGVLLLFHLPLTHAVPSLLRPPTHLLHSWEWNMAGAFMLLPLPLTQS